MDHNGHRGMAWFFHTDDRIEMFLSYTIPAPEPIPVPEACDRCNSGRIYLEYLTEGRWNERALRCNCPAGKGLDLTDFDNFLKMRTMAANPVGGYARQERHD